MVISPGQKMVIDRILQIIPEFEGRFCELGPGQIVQRNLQVLRENSEQLDLLFDVQLFNRRADLDYRTHSETLSPAESKSKPGLKRAVFLFVVSSLRLEIGAQRRHYTKLGYCREERSAGRRTRRSGRPRSRYICISAGQWEIYSVQGRGRRGRRPEHARARMLPRKTMNPR